MSYPYRQPRIRRAQRPGVPGKYVVAVLGGVIGLVFVAAMVASGVWRPGHRGPRGAALLPVGAPMR